MSMSERNLAVQVKSNAGLVRSNTFYDGTEGPAGYLQRAGVQEGDGGDEQPRIEDGKE